MLWPTGREGIQVGPSTLPDILPRSFINKVYDPVYLDRADPSRKVHYLLVQTLNAAFPEHDFAALQPEQFTREQHAGVVLEQLGGRLLYKAPALP